MLKTINLHFANFSIVKYIILHNKYLYLKIVLKFIICIMIYY